jgi:hypothetical protein
VNRVKTRLDVRSLSRSTEAWALISGAGRDSGPPAHFVGPADRPPSSISTAQPRVRLRPRITDARCVVLCEGHLSRPGASCTSIKSRIMLELTGYRHHTFHFARTVPSFHAHKALSTSSRPHSIPLPPAMRRITAPASTHLTFDLSIVRSLRTPVALSKL